MVLTGYDMMQQLIVNIKNDNRDIYGFLYQMYLNKDFYSAVLTLILNSAAVGGQHHKYTPVIEGGLF